MTLVRLRVLLIAIGLHAAGLASPLVAATIHVFAAASLSESLQAIGAAHEKATGDIVRFNFAASSLLARQIDEGAPADLFFSADEAKMDFLASHGRLVPGTRTNRLGNALVAVVASDSTLPLRAAPDLTNAVVRRIALADTATVPAGIYAREYLQRAGLWTAVQSRVVPTENVRGALAAVESGNVEAGMVYKTDAAISRKVRVAFEVKPGEGPDIRYPVALLKEAPQPEAARRFLQRIISAEAAEVFRARGFVVLP